MEYRELISIADNKNIKESVIDKDWVLGHFLNAMYELKDVNENFVFKGGTCLKKCYFRDYRFSEDLDFTLKDSGFAVDEMFFSKIISVAEQNSGAKFHLKEIKPQIHKDILQGYEVTILFWGAYHKPNQAILPVNRWQTKIKLDISFSEKVILEPEIKKIFHSYPDSDIVKNKVPVYPLNEITAEKLRSILQRNRPRDIFDLYYLSSIIQIKEYQEIYKLLKEKSSNKKVECCTYQDFVNQDKYMKNKRAWESSLVYHLPQGKLVDYDTAWKEVEKLVELILNQS